VAPDGFAIFHAKAFENLLEIPNLVHVRKTLCTIPLHFHAKEKMQIAKIFHFELSKKFFLHLQKLVLIITHQDEIIDVDNDEKFHILDLRNIHTSCKLDAFQENV